MDIQWEEPPATASIVGSGKHAGRYLDFALALQQRVGAWAVLPSDNTRTEKGASATAQNIRRGKVKGFTPAGAYETAVQGTKIWVRYKDQPEAPEGALPHQGGQDEAPSDRPDPADVRAWAKDQGIKVNDRGALPKHVFDRYAEAIANGETGLGLTVVRDSS